MVDIRGEMTRLRRALLLSALLTAAAVALPAGAPAATFGADLSLPVNGTRTCQQGFFPEAIMAQALGVAYASCTWWSGGSLTPGAGDALVPRGGGTLTRVRVKTGAVTGRMQVLVLRQIRHPSLGTSACCSMVAATDVFVPTPNAITELATNIAVRNGVDAASGVENFDLIALSSLDAGVPVPSSLGGSGYSGGSINGVFPHWDPSTEMRPDLGVVDFGQVLLAGDVQPADTNPPPPPPPPPPPLAQLARLNGRHPVTLARGGRAATVALRCGAQGACNGTVSLRGRASGAGAVTHGHAAYSLRAAHSAKVRVALSARARRVLRIARKLTVSPVLTAAGQTSAGAKVTLRPR
jgi:hypothetical protein